MLEIILGLALLFVILFHIFRLVEDVESNSKRLDDLENHEQDESGSNDE